MDHGSTAVQAGFFGPDRRLFGYFHPAQGEVRDASVLICRPYGYEGMQAYEAMRKLGHHLATAGIPTLRFDYPGSGESLAPRSGEGTVSAWVESAEAAFDHLVHAGGNGRVFIIGVRLGALLAAAGARTRTAEGLVLWEPVESGMHFSRELQILASARSDAGRDDGFIEATGFRWAREALEDLEQLEMGRMSLQGTPPVRIIRRADRRVTSRLASQLAESGHPVEEVHLDGFAEMMTLPFRSAYPRSVAADLLGWLEERTRVRDGGHRDVRASTELFRPTVDRGATHTARRLGETSLFALHSEPPADDPARTVVMLAGGAVPRTSVNDMYVQWSRQWSARGWRAVRIDAPGLGESPVRHGHDRNSAYPEHLVDDLESALEQLEGEHPTSRISIVGLCSGAYAAFQLALRRPSVDQVLLINPLVLHWSWRRALRLEDVDRYRGAWLARPDSSAEKGRRLGIRELGVRLWTWNLSRRVTARVLSGIHRAGIPVSSLEGDLDKLARRGVHIGLAFSEDDPGIAAVLGAYGATVRRLQAAGHLAMTVVSGADHTFSGMAGRTSLEEWLEGRVAEASDTHRPAVASSQRSGGA